MHQSDHILAQWERDHSYLGTAHGRNEGRTRLVLVLTLLMMAGEIAAGTVFNSMALLADGWHMASHAAALGMASLAYMFARRHARNETFSFGTGKVGDLAGFGSALVLMMIALLMAWESAQRLLAPVPIAYAEATMVAVLGLAVNLFSALLLGNDHSHAHDHGDGDGHGHGHAHHDHDHHEHPDHAHHHQAHQAHETAATAHHAGHAHAAHDDETDHRHHHRDHNFRAVYIHILADAVTSVLAIAALLAGRFLHWVWLDPVMGLVGAAVILRWSWTLIETTGRVLLDAEPSPGVCRKVRRAIERDGDNRVADLHVWRLGPGHLAAMLTVVTHHPQPPAHYKSLLRGVTGLSHVTIEVEACADEHAPLAA